MYDFDSTPNRQATNDLKWNRSLVEANLHTAIPEDFIPMWVADTDFACAPHIVTALQERVQKDAYGYCAPLPHFYDAVCWWQKERFAWKIDPSWVSMLPSVVSGINIAIRAFSNEGDGIIIQPPVYDPFSSIVKRTKRQVVSNTLRCVDGRYVPDFELLEKQAADPANKLMILCSPHNPVGRVWSPQELQRMADICLANNVLLVSDEIHSDIVYGTVVHTPLLSLDERYAQNFIELTAPSKTFNIPGLKASVSIIPNSTLKAAFDEMQIALSLDVRNTFGLEGLIAAYSPPSVPWVAEQLAYLQANVDLVAQFLQEKLPKVKMQRPEGSFLCWLDCTALGFSDEELMYRVDIKAGVICIPGPWFGQGGEQHLRLNIGCTRANLQKALDRIAEAVATTGAVATAGL